MTREEYYRWKDFSLRLAGISMRVRRRPSVEWVKEQLQDFFFECDWEDENPGCWPAQIKGWCYTGGGEDYLCDFMGDFCDRLNPYRYRLDADLEEKDTPTESGYFSRAAEQWHGQWFEPIEICLRAGIDAALNEDGVLGFTAGDIRAMYPEGLPDWVSSRFSGLDVIIPTGVASGVGFTFETKADGRPFEALPDDAAVFI